MIRHFKYINVLSIKAHTSQMTTFINVFHLRIIMASVQWFRIRPFLYMVLFVGVLNSYLMYSLAQGFFTQDVRLFLFIIFNEIYMFIGILTLYVYAKINNLERENRELKYIIKSISKRTKK